jgi:ribosomal protein L7/L12
MEFDEALCLARDMKEQGIEREKILARLRASGATIIDSLKVIRQIESVSLTEAKNIVDSSETWADKRAANERVRRALIQALEEEGAEQSV